MRFLFKLNALQTFTATRAIYDYFQVIIAINAGMHYVRNMSNSALIRVMTQAIHKAAKPLMRDFGEVGSLQVSKKGTADFVTNADLRTERILMEELSNARKDWAFLTEESGEVAGSGDEFRFVIDPIDGTTNFIHAIPYFCISVAAEQRNARGEYEAMLGMVFDPVHDEMFIAQKDGYSTVNNQKLQVSQRKQDWLVATTAPRLARGDLPQVAACIDAVARAGATVRCSGAAALDLAYVAAGRYDGVWYHRIQPWDTAAGALLVQRAGGYVDKLVGADGQAIDSSVLATNAAIFDPLTALLKAA